MKPRIVVYTTKKTNRLVYIISTIFEERLGCELIITRDKREFLEVDGVRLNYSSESIEQIAQILPSPLLFENRIRDIEVVVNDDSEIPWLFANPRCSYGFDPIAACFYLLSRYEEYLPYRKDEHGRFASSSSLLGRHQADTKPLVDIYIGQLGKLLNLESINDRTVKPSFKLEVTVDIDQLFMYRSKGIARSILGAIADLLRNRTSLMTRFDVIMGYKKDPLDIYDFIIQRCKRQGIRPKFFFQVGETSRFDINNPIHLPNVIQRLNEIASDADVGIHPSYYSSEKHDILESEIERLSSALGAVILLSRQHYLRFRIPTTFRKLEEHGIREDFSMGFPDKNGFRAGTSIPFKFYDLERDEPTHLTIHPLVFMDVLAIRNNATYDEALNEMLALQTIVRENGGTFNSTWHPETLIGLGVNYPSMDLLTNLVDEGKH
jgi:hypothetical protein